MYGSVYRRELDETLEYESAYLYSADEDISVKLPENLEKSKAKSPDKRLQHRD
jgi:hypothetical protein